MSQYDALDRNILKAIKDCRNPIYDRHVCWESDRIAEATGRKSFRVIDLRMQALRKAGKIAYSTKKAAASGPSGQGGWRLTGDAA